MANIPGKVPYGIALQGKCGTTTAQAKVPYKPILDRGLKTVSTLGFVGPNPNLNGRADIVPIPVTTPLYNLIPSYTEEFDQSSVWGFNNASITANVATAPDGTTTMDKLVTNTNTGTWHALARNSVPCAAGINRHSFFAKAAGRDFCHAFVNTLSNVGVHFDLSTGAVGSSASNILSASITSVGSGVYLCSYTFSIVSATTHTFVWNAVPSNGTVFSNGDGTSGIYLWGMSLTSGSTVRPYQRVGASTADVSQPAIPGIQTSAIVIP